MIDTFYVHLEFTGKGGSWSINLPFLCTKCGVCCTLEDFLTAGEINSKPEEYPEVHTKMKELSEALGEMWLADEAKYDNHIAHTPCSFLTDNACSIYEIRPDGCRLYPNTTFGMQTTDCEALTRFKKQRSTLKRGRTSKESYHFTKTSATQQGVIKPAKFTEKQYHACISKLLQAGITDDELDLFNYFNKKKEDNQRNPLQI